MNCPKGLAYFTIIQSSLVKIARRSSLEVLNRFSQISFQVIAAREFIDDDTELKRCKMTSSFCQAPICRLKYVELYLRAPLKRTATNNPGKPGALRTSTMNQGTS